LLAHGRWFSPGTPASSTTKTGRHDIAEILLKMALNTNKSINQTFISVTDMPSVDKDTSPFLVENVVRRGRLLKK
jgi:hypothetical protein